MAHRPNIILITSSQHNASALGFQSELYETPALDRLADEGLVLNRAYTACPLSTPARATWLTGSYPSHHGAWSVGTNLDERRSRLPVVLSKAGYGTAIIGQSHLQAVGQVANTEGASHRYDTGHFREWTGPWYGFDYAELHTGYGDRAESASMHYRAWLEDRRLSIPKYFREEGDGSESAGEWKLPVKSHPSTWVGDRAIDYLKGHAPEASDKPFFLSVNFSEPHPPYKVPKPWSKKFDDQPLGRPKRRWGEWEDKSELYRAYVDNRTDALGWSQKAPIPLMTDGGKFLREDLADWYAEEEEARLRTYAGMIGLMDENIGRILDAVDELNLYGDTLVVFTSDHGDYLGEHFAWGTGGVHYDGCTRVPTIVRWPGQIPSGTDSNALFSGVDLAPTLIEAAGIAPDSQMQGIGQLTVFRHPDQRMRRGVYIDHRVEAGLYCNSWVSDRYRLSVHHRIDGENDIELYDLDHDPDEFVNLAPSGKYNDIVAMLLSQMLGERSYLAKRWQDRPSFE